MTTDPLPPGTADAFERLRRRFLAGLPQRRADIRQAPDAEARADLLHRLAGAAGSFGFDALGRLARTAESAHRQNDAGASDAVLVELEAAIDTLLSMQT
ncbi:MAG: Hpt domain-containing protein [Gammaproteobacteria bacterium]|nr:Hpt domain-containing protein [Gammaproteobacteria bacterium]MBU1441333.1 Hpt domain-containing protein [Gammaproteobacteria bacterium]